MRYLQRRNVFTDAGSPWCNRGLPAPEKKPSDQLAKILEVANPAYDETGITPLPTLAEAYEGGTGDSLGAFIVIEIAEVTEGMEGEDAWQEARRAIQVAADQLQAVADALDGGMVKRGIPQGEQKQ
jgi:hypothetical protein